MIDISFNNGSYFVSIVPFFTSTDNTGISTEIPFRIDINHPPAFRRGAGVITITLPERPAGIRVIDPAHFRADKLKGRQSAPEIRSASFRLHGKRGIMRTAGNTVFINGIINIFKMSPCIKWYVSFREVAVFAKGIARKERFVKLYCIKSSITEKNFRIDQWMLGKEISQGGDKQF